MEEVLLRFPHLAEKIFKLLTNKSFVKCQSICKSWTNFIIDQKFFWMRLIQIHVKKGNLPPLHPSYEEAHTQDGEKYFKNHSTRSTQWEDPRIGKSNF